MNRRSLLAHATVALTGGAAIAFAVPDLEARATTDAVSSVENLFQAWVAAFDDHNAYDQYNALREGIVAATPTNMRELAMQIYAETDGGDFEMRDGLRDSIKVLAFAGRRHA